MAIVIGNQVYGVPAIELGDAFGFQPLDDDLTEISALATTTYGRAFLTQADASAAQTHLGISTFVKTILDDADAAAVRTTIGLGTAATQNTGTSGSTVPLLNTSPTFSGGTLAIQATGTFGDVQIRRADAHGDNAVVGRVVFRGTDDAANNQAFGEMTVVCLQDANGAESADYRFATFQAGTLANRMQVGGGIYHSSATGGDKGNNTINFGAVYDDNTLLTCMAMAEEFRTKGVIDLDKWDALVPNIEIPERIETVPVMADVEVERVVDERSEDGSLVRKTIIVTEQATQIELEPVWDEGGNGVDAVEHLVTEEIIIPAETIQRIHGTARVFKAMCDAGFDPRDPEQYFAKMRNDEALPGMPTQADWEQNGLCMGEMFSRKWLAMEMLAIVSNAMWLKLNEHDARLAALEASKR
ncbi:hypothetical protein [Aminobacter sp. MDW-2]|uniref:hypothetical protein n=1 Tax=Aminobacter sp. MDW-2 TaxID=2666139 RepID=UPI0012AF443C|nr:hypothetical protein [Aminobacter sp. MDW-2]MRX31925.1 hypothetical protein [Aminobacter sp. MDW-2]QNH32398.1 hypothetical protein H5P29_17770 [Aminobacter sp. MDW-2]